MDSSGVGRLVECYSEVNERDGELKLVRSSPRVEQLLQITGLHQVFESFASERLAVVSF